MEQRCSAQISSQRCVSSWELPVDAAGTFVYASFQTLVFEATLASGSALTFGLTATVNHGQGAC